MKTITLMQSIIALLVISGCSSTPPVVTTPPQAVHGVKIKGVSATNAVITKQSGKYFYYRKKCASCGFISPKTIGSGLPNGLFRCTSKFVCPKCAKISEVSIQRTIKNIN